MGICLCCLYVKDIKPRPLDPSDIYQQVEITRKRYGFHANSVAENGFPPEFLRRKGWSVEFKDPSNYYLDEALGLNFSLRAHLPDFNFPLSMDCSKGVVVGKWYTPFAFVKEGTGLKDQMKMSTFYGVRLEQIWEKIYSEENTNNKDKAVFVDAVVQRESVVVAGREAVWDERNVVDGFLWFRSFDGVEGEINVGLDLAIIERMRWEQESAGWVGENERLVKLKRMEEYGGGGGWKRFGCYVLVESYVFLRMDGSTVMKYDFRHPHQIKCKWE